MVHLLHSSLSGKKSAEKQKKSPIIHVMIMVLAAFVIGHQVGSNPGVALSTATSSNSKCHAKVDALFAQFDERKSVRVELMASAPEVISKNFFDRFEPDAVCIAEERFGGNSDQRFNAFGDGPKFTCGVDHLRQLNAKQESEKCLVYSIGSNNDIKFEKAVKHHIGCEIHTFDPTLKQDFVGHDYATFHPWGLGKEGEVVTVKGSNFTSMSLEHIMRDLGHTNRTIDIFKIDCEGCEYAAMIPAFEAIAQGKLRMNQILIELHKGGFGFDSILSFFAAADKAGYYITHKERNHWGCDGWRCVEYAFTSKEFLRQVTEATVC